MFRVVDSTGQRLHAFGRPGEGPGEFRSPLQLLIRGDSLRFFDAGRMSLVDYNREGKSLGESRAIMLEFPLAWVGDSVDHWMPPAMAQSERSVIRRSLVGDTAGRVLIAEEDSGFQAVLASMPGEQPLLRLAYVAAWDRIYLADAYNYQIYSYDGSGQPLASFGLQLPPHYMGARQLAEQRASILSQPKFIPRPNRKPLELPDESDRLDTLKREITPHFMRAPLHVDAGGRLWVIGLTNDSTTVDVFADTTFLGRTVLPCYLGRTGYPAVLSRGWLLLECELPEAAELSSELQLYRIVEGGDVHTGHQRAEARGEAGARRRHRRGGDDGPAGRPAGGVAGCPRCDAGYGGNPAGRNGRGQSGLLAA